MAGCLYPDECTYGERVALLDEQLAVALFQYAEPLSEEIQIAGEKYRVIGIVRDHKRVGDQEEYSLYVPYRSLVCFHASVMSCVIFEGKPVKGAGGWAAFQSAAKQLSESGSTHSLPKESMNGKMPLRHFVGHFRLGAGAVFNSHFEPAVFPGMRRVAEQDSGRNMPPGCWAGCCFGQWG